MHIVKQSAIIPQMANKYSIANSKFMLATPKIIPYNGYFVLPYNIKGG